MAEAPLLLIASMDVSPDHENLFNEVYDQEHVPNLLKVPGVLSVTRYERQGLIMSIGGERVQMPVKHPKYHALYVVESAGVLVSDAWAKAVELGRWPAEVRPFTMNRQHMLGRKIGR